MTMKDQLPDVFPVGIILLVVLTIIVAAVVATVVLDDDEKVKNESSVQQSEGDVGKVVFQEDRVVCYVYDWTGLQRANGGVSCLPFEEVSGYGG